MDDNASDGFYGAPSSPPVVRREAAPLPTFRYFAVPTSPLQPPPNPLWLFQESCAFKATTGVVLGAGVGATMGIFFGILGADPPARGAAASFRVSVRVQVDLCVRRCLCGGLCARARVWVSWCHPFDRAILIRRRERVQKLKNHRPELMIELNGGINTINDSIEALKVFDGAMVGRAAYSHPFLWTKIDSLISRFFS